MSKNVWIYNYVEVFISICVFSVYVFMYLYNILIFMYIYAINARLTAWFSEFKSLLEDHGSGTY